MRKLYLLFLFSLLVSCRATKPLTTSSSTATKPAVNNPETSYISRYKDIAISEMKRTGIPASITLAQGMIESNNGKSALAKDGNNHFGIKCHNGWTGSTIRHDDERNNECFRKYRSAEESFSDHSDFLRSGSRYSFLFNLSPYDYKAWASGLRKAGYATNPDYANMLIRKIEQYNLAEYDDREEKPFSASRKAFSKKTEDKDEISEANMTASVGNDVITGKVQRIMDNNRVQYIVVKEGETREILEKEFKLLGWELSKYNELESDFMPESGQILYLQPKRDKAEPGKEQYTVKKVDTMYQISQKFGIKLRKLYEYNRMEQGAEPKPGTKLWLRSMKPVK
jgi:LysM repeat protein